jgi:hypothetical protein
MKKEKTNNWKVLKQSAAQYPLRMTGAAMWVVTLTLIILGAIVGVWFEKAGVWICFAGVIVFLSSFAVLAAAYGMDK